MTHASVFSGIGGPEVAASMLGWENLFHCEINPFGRAVLDYWYPNSKSYEDITKTDFSEWRGKVDVLTGGFPCQPFSFAGKRRGADDDRYLWPHMHRCINEVKPTWVVAENVGGILTMVEQGKVAPVEDAPALFDEDGVIHRYEYRSTFTLERICRDLEADGYEVQPVLIPACSVGAPHKRDRVFIVARRIDAHTDGPGDTPQGEGAAGTRQGADIVSGQAGRREGYTPGGNNGLSTILRTATDPSDAGAEGLRQERQDAIHRPEPAAYPDSWRGFEVAEPVRLQLADGTGTERTRCQWPFSYTHGEGLQEPQQPRRGAHQTKEGAGLDDRAERPGVSGAGRWEYDERRLWMPTQSPVHTGNDGISLCMDGVAFPFSIGDKDPFVFWRNEALKAYGNAIVPQVMYEIFRAIEQVELNS